MTATTSSTCRSRTSTCCRATACRPGGRSSTGWAARLAGAQGQGQGAASASMAGELINIAAERALRDGRRIDLPPGLYDEFCARFPYEETEDQLKAIEAVLEDLASGRPMDRLVCGDVGFGKTEVALRAAFVVAMSRQAGGACWRRRRCWCASISATFTERFEGLPVRVGAAVAARHRQGGGRGQEGPRRRRGRDRHRHPCAARQGSCSSRTWAW